MPESIAGFLLHIFHRRQHGKTQLCAIGKLENGQTFALVDDRHPPAFYLRAADLDSLRPQLAQTQIASAPLSTMDNEQVLEISAHTPTALNQVADQLAQQQKRTYEADLPYPRHWQIRRGIGVSLRLSGPYQAGDEVDRIYLNPQLEPSSWEPELAVLSLDIETTPDASRTLAFSLVGTGPQERHNLEEVHLIGAPEPTDPDYLHAHADESALLKALVHRLKAIDPDVLTGWNVIDFDLRVLQERFTAGNVPFLLGRSREPAHYLTGKSWGGSRMIVPGRQAVDALHLVRASLQPYDDHRLGTVARAVLDRDKILHPDDEEPMPQRIERAYREDREQFAQYCLEDARLVRDILAATGLMQLTLRRSLLTGLPLERAWGSVAAFDQLYIGQLRRKGLVAPTLGVDQQKSSGSPGGLIMTPQAGLHRHIFVFDFKSLYPSLMRTFNIDPLAQLRASGDQGDIVAPNGAHFARDQGILPELLERFWQRREEAKKAADPLASFTYKILMNSFYGVLATDACRFADDRLAGAITGLGHYVLRWTRDTLQAQDCRVLYGDTDSVFIDAGLGENIEDAAAFARGAALCAALNRALDDHLQQRFGVNSHLELEFEKYYRRFFIPNMRGSHKGRAKGYAGLRVEPKGDRVEIVGMEAVRRDWTDMAHQLQRQLLGLLFADAPAQALEECVGAWVSAVYAGEKDALLVYRKRLRKNVASYQRNVPPHVRAARLLANPRGVIHYLITRDGPQPESQRQAPIDYDHYVRKQIEPIVSTIAQVCPIDVAAAVRGEPRLFRLPAAAH